MELFVAELVAEATEQADLLKMRQGLQPNTIVRVSRFDKTGRVVKVDAKKRLVTVSLGLGQWEVPFDEIFPSEG